MAIVMATVAAAGATPLIAATGRPSLLGFVAGMMLTTPAVLIALVHAAERGPLSATS